MQRWASWWAPTVSGRLDAGEICVAAPCVVRALKNVHPTTSGGVVGVDIDIAVFVVDSGERAPSATEGLLDGMGPSVLCFLVGDDMAADAVEEVSPDSVWVLARAEGCEPTLARYPPFDIPENKSIWNMPQVPNATIACEYTLTDGPFGNLKCVQRFVEGQLQSYQVGSADDADIRIVFPYLHYLQLRLGRITLLDALKGGGVSGELGRVSLLAGLLEGPEFQSAWRSNASILEALADAIALVGPHRLRAELNKQMVALRL